jgi:hypothetical protein
VLRVCLGKERMSAPTGQPAYPCSECDESPGDASTCCFECQALLCTFHTEAHQRTKMTKTHKLEKISELGPIAQQYAAPTLQNVPIDNAAPILSSSGVSSMGNGHHDNNFWTSSVPPNNQQWWGPHGVCTSISQLIGVNIFLFSISQHILYSLLQFQLSWLHLSFLTSRLWLRSQSHLLSYLHELLLLLRRRQLQQLQL